MPAEEFVSPRIVTPTANTTTQELSNPFEKVTPNLNKEKKYARIENNLA